MSSLITEFPHKVITRTFFNEHGTGLLCVSNTCENSDGSKYTFSEYLQYPTQVWFETPTASDSTYVDEPPMASAPASVEEQPVVSPEERLEQDRVFALALAKEQDEEQDKEFAQTSAQPTTGSWANVAKATAQPKEESKAQPKAQATAQPGYKYSLQENRQEVIDCFTQQIKKAVEDNVFAGERGSTFYTNIYRGLSPEHASECRRMIEVGEEASDFWKKRSLTPPMSVVRTTLPNWLEMTIVPSSPTRKWPLVLLHVKGYLPKIW